MPRLSVPADHPHRREISKLENSFNASLIRALDKQRRDLMRGITAETISRLPAMLNDENIVTPLQNAIERMLLQIAESGASVGIDEIDSEIARITKADIGINWELVNEAVATWARTYAHDLVTGINTTTSRKLTRQIIAFSESPDMTMKQLAANIAPIFGADRASNIAVTETTRAYAQGNMQAWENSGVTEGIRWNTANDERVCPICGPLNQVVVSRGEMFPGNIDNPPAHPRCRCWITPVVDMEKVETSARDIINIETAGLNEGVNDPFINIRPPEGRAPRGLGQEYAARRSIVSKLETQSKFRSQLQFTVDNYRGQRNRRAQIDQAIFRIEKIDEAMAASFDFLEQDADWDFKKDMIDSIIDYVSQVTRRR